MFELRPEIKYLRTSREQIVAIIESINQPMVAASGRPSEAAMAYIIGVRNPSGLFSVYVYLYLVDSNECLIYLHEPREIPMEDYHEQELEALGFVESMGFIVDNTNFRNLKPVQQQQLYASLPMFQADLDAFAKSRASVVETTAADEQPELVDLSPLEEEVIELQEVAEEMVKPAVQARVLSPEGLAKIARLLASF